jgi:hypothetical protein
MTSLVDLKSYRTSRRTVFLQKDELRQLMNLYSKRVMTGEWKDYAIDFQEGHATFTVFKNTFDAPLYSIVKLRHRGSSTEEWLIFSAEERLRRSGSLAGALAYFDKKLSVVR